MRLGDVAAELGKGIFAGTAAMALSSTIEMKVRGRPASSTPPQAAAKVLSVERILQYRRLGKEEQYHALHPSG